MHHGIYIYVVFHLDVLVFAKPHVGSPHKAPAPGPHLLSPSCGVSGSLFSAPRWCFARLSSCSFSFCCLPFEGSFARLFRKGTFFCFYRLNKNMNKRENHQKADSAPEQSRGCSSLQPTPAEEVSAACPSSNISEYFIV